MVTCAKLQQSCQSSLYRELGELIREKAFCQPSASKSQSLPNLPLFFIIFDHFDSPYFSYYFCWTQKKLSRLCSAFVALSLPLAWRVNFIFDSSTQAWFCQRWRLALDHLEEKRKKRRYLGLDVGISTTLQDWTSACRLPVSVICTSSIFFTSLNVAEVILAP